MAHDNRKPLTERGRFWLTHIHRQAQGEGTRRQYCRDHDLSESAFAWWRRELKQRGWLDPNAETGRFVRVPVPAATVGATGGRYEIRLTNQRQLILTGDFEAPKVARLVALLDPPC